MSYLIKNAWNRRQDMPADHLSEHHSVVSEATPLSEDTTAPRTVVFWAPSWTPPSRFEATPPAPSKTSITIDLIDFHLQFSKQESFNLLSQLCRQIIPHFERCNSPCSSADGCRRQQKSLPIITGIIRAVMMNKSQCANHVVMEICNIRTFGDDV